jgi:hypothetical protein
MTPTLGQFIIGPVTMQRYEPENCIFEISIKKTLYVGSKRRMEIVE